MSLPLVPLAIGAAALWFLNQKKAPGFSTVKASSGRTWYTRTLGVTGSGDARVVTVEVWAPAGSFGPHLDTLVATYQQKGSDQSSRVALSTGPDAVPAMITAAGQDFQIKKPS
jgi:hypothetical protein